MTAIVKTEKPLLYRHLPQLTVMNYNQYRSLKEEGEVKSIIFLLNIVKTMIRRPLAAYRKEVYLFIWTHS